MFTVAELIEAQLEIAGRAGYPLTGDRRAGYTARRFANDLNTIWPGVVRVTNGRPHQLYHALRGAMRVPPYWERPVRELLKLARIGGMYPPTPSRRRLRGRVWIAQDVARGTKARHQVADRAKTEVR